MVNHPRVRNDSNESATVGPKDDRKRGSGYENDA
jgi:hypothetical protein